MKVVETQAKMKQIDAAVDALTRSSQRCNLTLTEVKSLAPNVTTYQSVGRMFVKAQHETITKDLETAIKLSAERIQELEKNKSILEKSLKDKENSLREIISQRQQKSD